MSKESYRVSWESYVNVDLLGDKYKYDRTWTRKFKDKKAAKALFNQLVANDENCKCLKKGEVVKKVKFITEIVEEVELI